MTDLTKFLNELEALDPVDFASMLNPITSVMADPQTMPPPDLVWRALEEVRWCDIRVVILGQDPYQTPGAAIGRAFACPPSQGKQPSLERVLVELKRDCGGTVEPTLDLWVDQGVVLLNSALTVRANFARSHRTLWTRLFPILLRGLCSGSLHPVHFMLWGKDARDTIKQAFSVALPNHSTGRFADRYTYHTTDHPSPINPRSQFVGSAPFSTANKVMSSPIRWTR
jgi:uracil-DNA glycosylase